MKIHPDSMKTRDARTHLKKKFPLSNQYDAINRLRSVRVGFKKPAEGFYLYKWLRVDDKLILAFLIIDRMYSASMYIHEDLVQGAGGFSTTTRRAMQSVLSFLKKPCSFNALRHVKNMKINNKNV